DGQVGAQHAALLLSAPPVVAVVFQLGSSRPLHSELNEGSGCVRAIVTSAAVIILAACMGAPGGGGSEAGRGGRFGSPGGLEPAPADVAKLTIYVVTYSPRDFAAIREAGAEFLPSRNPPAGIVVGVQSLPMEGLLIAVDATAVIRAMFQPRVR